MGEIVGNYRITGELNRGGMGVVYRAEHVTMAQPAVVKKLLPELSQHREVVERFFQEARAAAAIQDPGIVRIFDQGVTEDGAAYIVMELLDGESLATRLTRGPLDPEVATTLVRQTARVLAAAHARGIVHRDLKPDNLFLVADPEVPAGERIKVLDFGIAKLTNDSRVKTMTRLPMGTPDYMSPEQWSSSARVDGRTDVYALGVILYEMLTARRPFPGPGLPELMDQHRFTPPPSPSVTDARLAPFDPVVARALAKHPADRYSSMDDLARALPGPPGPRPAPPAPRSDATDPDPDEAAPDGDAVARAADPTRLDPAAARPARLTARRRWPLMLGLGAAGAGVAATLVMTGGGSSGGPTGGSATAGDPADAAVATVAATVDADPAGSAPDAARDGRALLRHDPARFTHDAAVMFAVDRSGSMSGARLDAVRAAIAAGLDIVPSGVRVGVIGFDSAATELAPLGEVATARAALAAIEPGGGSDLATAFELATLRLAAERAEVRLLVLITDGPLGGVDRLAEVLRRDGPDTRILVIVPHPGDPDVVVQRTAVVRGVAPDQRLAVALVDELGQALTSSAPAAPAPLTPADLAAAAARSAPGIQRCYQRAVRTDPYLAIRSVVATVTVTPAGVVGEVQLSQTAGTELGDCLTARIRGWRFAPSPRGLTAPVTIELGEP